MSTSNAQACKKRITFLNPEDRISQLPEPLTGNILSRLPTEVAVKTSILSRTWRYKWTSICDFNFHDERRESDVTSFIRFVCRILFRTCNSKIRSFSLTCKKKYEPGYLETWISCVLARNVEILILRVLDVKLDSPWCFEGWTSLTELALTVSCILVIPADNHFPNLKRLVLGTDHAELQIKPEQSSTEGSLILTFPALEHIHLGCQWLDVKCVEIHAPELITFEDFCEYHLNPAPTHEMKIVGAAKLDEFVSTVIINYTLQGSPSVTSADIYNLDHPFDPVTNLPQVHNVLKQLPNLEFLTLSSEIVEHLVQPYPGFVFPKFDRLTELFLGYGCNMKDVQKLLQLFPPVESLQLNLYYWDNDPVTMDPWPPKTVSKLESLIIDDFREEAVQLDFLRFVLKEAKNLEKVSVGVNDEVSDVAAQEIKASIDQMALQNSSVEFSVEIPSQQPEQ